MKTFCLVVAVDAASGIGKAGKLPWQLPADLRHFKELTTATDSASLKNAVIMGRKTWESIPKKFRPLSERVNVVLTRNKSLTFPPGVLSAENLNDALDLINKRKKDIEAVYVIGGAEVFQEALRHPQCKKIYMTHILNRFDCDAFFPEFRQIFEESFQSPHFTGNSIPYYFAVYQRI